MLTFRDSIKSFKLDGNLLRTMTFYKFNAGHSNLLDQKIIREFAEEMKFHIKNWAEKVLERIRLLSCLNHQLSWYLEIRQHFYHPILLNYLAEQNCYYKRNELVTIQTKLLKKLLL